MDIKWHIRFLEDARHASRNSKDPTTKCGAVIVRPDKTIAALGYNGFPRGMPDREEDYNHRPEKLSRVIHAEMNAILHAREPLHGYTLYCYPFMPCERCAVHIIQAGIKLVISPPCPEEKKAKWTEIHDKSKDYFIECGVQFLEIPLIS